MRLKPYWISICQSPVSSILFDVRQWQQQLFTIINVQCVTMLTTYFSQIKKLKVLMLQRLVAVVAFTRHFLNQFQYKQFTRHKNMHKNVSTVIINTCLEFKLMTTLIIAIKIKISVRKSTGWSGVSSSFLMEKFLGLRWEKQQLFVFNQYGLKPIKRLIGNYKHV